MIELRNVTKFYRTAVGRHYVMRDVSLIIPDDINVGLIGPNGAGKSTFLRLIAGSDIPDSGRIIREGKISWPIGLTPGVLPNLNGPENTRFTGRIYGMKLSEIKATINRVRELAQLGKYFDLNVGQYSSGMRQRLSFAISMAMEFDYYIFDEISAGGDLTFRTQAREMMTNRINKSKFIIATHKLPEVKRLCQAAIYINRGELRYFQNVDEAIQAYETDYKPMQTKTRGQSVLLDSDDDDDDDVLAAAQAEAPPEESVDFRSARKKPVERRPPAVGDRKRERLDRLAGGSVAPVDRAAGPPKVAAVRVPLTVEERQQRQRERIIQRKARMELGKQQRQSHDKAAGESDDSSKPPSVANGPDGPTNP